MPFTLSHAVLAPPLSKLSKGHLPIAALAIGCMTPDLYRLLFKTEVHINHQWQGILYPDLWVGLFFSLLWYALYRPTIFKILGIEHRIQICHFYGMLTFIIKICFAIIIGTATHIIWDGLTHLDFRTFAFYEFLAQSVTIGQHTYPVHRVLQIGSSIIALPFLGWMCIQYFLKYRHPHVLSRQVKASAIALFSISIACGFCSYAIRIQNAPAYVSTDLYEGIGFFVKTFTQGTAISFTLGCLIFLYLTRKRQ